ncbi:hypothetical protein ACFW0I_25355 [[Kitasatospora] papulosa]|uniref:hypothetical protein n=2 Tax=[Kitasatospora] papulosa TaxID=1464011 RepID=UPI0036CCD2C3
MAPAKTADVRAAYLGGRSMAAQVRGHHVSRGAICTALGDLLPYHTASVQNALVPELPVTLDMPGKVADCLRITELEPAERAALEQGTTVRRGQGYTLRTAPSPPYTEGSSPAASRSMAARGLPAVPLELRRRAVRMVSEARDDYPNETTDLQAVTEKLRIGSREALRNWLKQHEIDAGTRPGTASEEPAQLKALKDENAELKRSNAVLEAAASFFVAGLDRPTHTLVAFIDEHWARCGGVEPICRLYQSERCRAE